MVCCWPRPQAALHTRLQQAAPWSIPMSLQSFSPLSAPTPSHSGHNYSSPPPPVSHQTLILYHFSPFLISSTSALVLSQMQLPFESDINLPWLDSLWPMLSVIFPLVPLTLYLCLTSLQEVCVHIHLCDGPALYSENPFHKCIWTSRFV